MENGLRIIDEMKKRYGFIYVDMDGKGNGTLERKKMAYDWIARSLLPAARTFG